MLASFANPLLMDSDSFCLLAQDDLDFSNHFLDAFGLDFSCLLLHDDHDEHDDHKNDHQACVAKSEYETQKLSLCGVF